MNLKKTPNELETIQSQRSAESRFPLFGILENIRSLYNVGSIFRTADGAGFSELFLTGITGAPPSKEIEKTALGATTFLPWKRFSTVSECIRQFQGEFTCVALEHTHRSIPYTAFNPPPDRPILLVVGNEITGIENDTLELCPTHVEIPMFGKKHSLNVSVAFGILAFYFASFFRK